MGGDPRALLRVVLRMARPLLREPLRPLARRRASALHITYQYTGKRFSDVEYHRTCTEKGFLIFFFAKRLPSWPPSPEIRTAHAKFTDFHVCVYRITEKGESGCAQGQSCPRPDFERRPQ